MEIVCEDNIKSEIQNGYKLLMEGIKFSNQLHFKKTETLSSDINRNIALITDRTLSMMSVIFKNQNIKGNLVNRDIDEKLDILSSVNDKLLDKAKENMAILDGSNCDPVDLKKLKRIDKTPKPSWHEDIKKTVLQIKEKDKHGHSKKGYLQTRNMEKPQLLFRDKIDNSPVPFIPRLTEKPNAVVPLSLDSVTSLDGVVNYCNPYSFEINNFSVPESQLTRVTPTAPSILEDTTFVYVDNEEKLISMMNHLKNEKELAVDIENHSYRSFQGFSCLIQISTRSQDYIIDGIMMRDRLWHLNKVFTDTNIVKVFHGAELDILWLQRDFGLYVVNMFDTRQAAIRLNFQQLGLANLLRKYCSVETKKKYQLYDWRVRPLPSDVLKYARMDTHYLLYIYDMLRNSLLDVVGGETDLLELVYNRSAAICIQQYEKDTITKDSYLKVYKLGRRNFDNRQLFALKNLYDWRDNLARKEDESTGYVLPNHMLLQIADALPREPQGILACCNPIPHLVRKHLNELHDIITKARHETAAQRSLEHRRSYHTQGPVIPQQFNLHDTTNSADFRNDLPTLLAGTDIVTVDHDLSLLARFTLNVFNDEKSYKSSHVTQKSRISFLTPYQRYKNTMLFNEAQKTKETMENNVEHNEEHQGNENEPAVKIQDTRRIKADEDADVKIKQEKTENVDTIEIFNLNKLQGKRKKKTRPDSFITERINDNKKSKFDFHTTDEYTNLENIECEKKIKIESDIDDVLPTTSAACIAADKRRANNNNNVVRPSSEYANKTEQKPNRFQPYDYSKINFSKFMSDPKTKNSLKKFTLQMRKNIWARKQKRRNNANQKAYK